MSMKPKSMQSAKPMSKKEVASAAMRLALAVAEAIKAVGRIPSGHLYALFMEKGMTIETYEAIVGCLKRSRVVREVANELIWNGETPMEDK